MHDNNNPSHLADAPHVAAECGQVLLQTLGVTYVCQHTPKPGNDRPLMPQTLLPLPLPLKPLSWPLLPLP